MYLKILVCSFLFVVALGSQAEAKIFGHRRVNSQPQQVVQPTHSGSGVAQQKANIQASNQRMQHLGGSFGGGRYEGVGFSTSSPEDAIRKCCYWGQRTPVDIGVQRGNNGWYATVLYK